MNEWEKNRDTQKRREVGESDPEFPISACEDLGKISLSGEQAINGNEQTEDT